MRRMSLVMTNFRRFPAPERVEGAAIGAACPAGKGAAWARGDAACLWQGRFVEKGRAGFPSGGATAGSARTRSRDQSLENPFGCRAEA